MQAMKRREFSAAAACVLGAAALGLPGIALAQRKPEEGKDYRALDKAAPGGGAGRQDRAGRVLLVQLPALQCLRAAPAGLAQAAPAGGRRVPPRAGRLPRRLRAAAAPVLHAGSDGQGGRAACQGVRGRPQGQPAHQPRRPDPAFAEKNGLDRAKFQELYNSFSVQTKARRAKQLQDQYQVDGVPALGVAGRYYTDATMAGSMERSLQVVEYLIAEARRAK
jgi:thiol:disulfide interchange protein DsbA